MTANRTPPTIDPALCVELGSRVVVELNSAEDWKQILYRLLSWPPVDVHWQEAIR